MTYMFPFELFDPPCCGCKILFELNAGLQEDRKQTKPSKGTRSPKAKNQRLGRKK